MRIDRCICHDVLFEALHREARRHGCATVNELQAHTDFGQGCGLCHAYVAEMLRTGQTVFTELVERPDPGTAPATWKCRQAHQ
ncbi:MAG: (2Fe-2S)-binding protein [Bacteroidetes bacterium CG12_big_fil_rev_8_21_14_0_65_60_17]|nr:MAG: (2Fe-2S)-binding protein [Bacteroidetes bacterium CG12_big_fil_rev_8_21_14_0_65_60_17]